MHHQNNHTHELHHQHLQTKNTVSSHSNETDYNFFQAPNGNIVWAGALTLAWKELLKSASHSKKFTVVGPPYIQKIADNFNYSPFSQGDLNPNSFYIKCGKGQQTVTLINKQRNEKFPQCTFPPIQADLSPEGIISYAYLYKKITYPCKFKKRLHKDFLFHGKSGIKKVESFTAQNFNQLQQVLIYDYKNQDEFLISLKDSNNKDQIFLYKTPDGKKVQQVIHHIQNIIITKKDNICSILNSDEFQVPILNLDYNHTVKELIGAKLQELPGLVIEQIMEGVKLKLDESGAVVENQGMIFMDECAIMNPDPKKLLLNSPFWVVMKEKNKHPYLCVRINNID